MHVAHAQSELDVLDGGEPAVERVVALEDHRAVAAGAGDGTAFHQDPARRGRLEAREHLEDRRLAAAARAEQAEELADLDVEAEVL